MESINAEFKFNNVGQGLFYTGVVTKKSRELLRFITVYDCGSTRKDKFLNEAISEFAEILPSNEDTIDLLTISHFHEDHVKGLPNLLKKFKKINTVVIPYLSIYQKAIYISTAASDLPAEILALYRDPVQFFADRNAKNIIVIMGPEEEGLDGERVEGTIAFEELDITSDAPTKVMKARVNLSISTTTFEWVFNFFNNGSLKDIASDFLEKLRRIVDSNLKKALIDKSVQSEIRKLYKSINSDINETSVLLFHYPTRKGIIKTNCYDCYWNYAYYIWDGYYRFPCYTLLTGDINFQGYTDEIFRWIKKISDSDSGIIGSVVSVPHHGSRENWDEHLVEYFKDSIFVVSYGISNQYGHPAHNVRKDILFSSNILAEVTQYQGFSYSISLHI